MNSTLTISLLYGNVFSNLVVLESKWKQWDLFMRPKQPPLAYCTSNMMIGNKAIVPHAVICGVWFYQAYARLQALWWIVCNDLPGTAFLYHFHTHDRHRESALRVHHSSIVAYEIRSDLLPNINELPPVSIVFYQYIYPVCRYTDQYVPFLDIQKVFITTTVRQR